MARNIVLLSDGTGNSSAKLLKTNVWRLYEAVDLSSGDQLALYDNGVGTSSFKLFALLGGGLGWGLKRNVRTLYTFACRNFAAGGDGITPDQLYAFGFSRGAFTIRVLVGLIESQGLIAGAKGAELERCAKWAYRAYRAEVNPGTHLVRLLRRVRDRLLPLVEPTPRYSAVGNVRPRIAFVGLWDTVDAYGLPVDEMTRGWDQWVWPLSLTRHDHPASVDKLCHAVAIDDERHTFHPVLLDETHEPAAAHTDEERLTQVWFAGVHSNVGGGYPDDSLAYVPLRWMAAEACKRGLRLHSHVTAEWKARSDPNGPANDSRSGLGLYYRYNPRSIKKLTDDRFADVRIPRPKIHESVFKRIGGGRDDYAPIVLPDRYAIVEDGGAIVDGAANPFEALTQSSARCADQERVWNIVWWRRIAYFTTVIVTIVLLAAPFVFDDRGLLRWTSRAIAGVIALLGNFLPGMAAPWINYYQHDPWLAFIGAAAIAVLFVLSGLLQRSIRDRMRLVWDPILTHPGMAVGPPNPPTDWVYRLRSSRTYRNVFETVTQRVLPFVFGIGCLLVAVLVGIGTVNRVAFATASAAGRICPAGAQRAWSGEPVQVELPSRELCQSTGLILEPGELYTVSIDLPPDWSDAGLPVESAEGFSSGRKPLAFIPFLPFRRVLTAYWFVPMVRIGGHGAEYHTLDAGTATFTPGRGGELFLFVNDAIGIGPLVRDFYCNNIGTARVTIRQGAEETNSDVPRPLPASRRQGKDESC